MSSMKGLVLGGFSDGTSFYFTPKSRDIDKKLDEKLTESVKLFNFDGKSKKTLVLTNICKDHPFIVITGLGEDRLDYCRIQEIDLRLENIRTSLYRAIKSCHENDITEITLDDFGFPQCVGEICALSIHEVGQWKSRKEQKKYNFSLLDDDQETQQLFREGIIQGEAQVIAATLAETPANLKAPRKIAEHIISLMPSSVTCISRDLEWIKQQKMELFLSVNQGSVEPPVLLEAHYKGSPGQPIVLVGKGITFDSGGISLKPAQSMSDMKADMQGAAIVFATIKAIATLKLPIHVIGIAPFTENMPSGSATRPGDVYRAMNGKTVEIDNTDAEGRLVLGDALSYADTFHPSQIIDLATLTGAVGVALGTATSAIYTTSPAILSDFKQAGSLTGDRVWHMPLFREYLKMIESKVADLVNSTKRREAGSCTAAAFLSEFVQTKDWAHLDIAGVMTSDKEAYNYCPGGMSGRPTRTLIEYLRRQIQK